MRPCMNWLLVTARIGLFSIALAQPALAADKKEKPKLPERPLIESFRTQANPAQLCGGTGADSARRQSIDGVAYGVVADPPLDIFLNKIKDKLLKVSPLPNCPIHVYVIPQEHFAASAAADGGIFLPMGLLRDLKSEDEIAAVLAHEITHVLKNHHKSDDFLKAQQGMLKAGETLMGAYSAVQQVSGIAPAIDGQTSMNIAEAVYAVSENVIAPNWTSGQEDEADLMGADLFIAAGYNKAAIATMMAKLEDWEKKIAKRDKAKDQFVQASLQANAMSIAGAAGSAMAAPSAANIGGMLARLAPGAITAIAGSNKGEDHRPVSERKADVIQYLGAFYKTSPRPPLGAAQWDQQRALPVFSHYASASKARVLMEAGQLEQASKLAQEAVSGPTAAHAYPQLTLYEVANRQGRPDAVSHLDAILRNPLPPIAGYRYAAAHAIKTGNTPQAAGFVDEANRRYDTPVSFIPEAIRLYQQTGHQEKVPPLLARCQMKGDKATYAVCQSAAGGSSPQAGQQQPAAQRPSLIPGLPGLGGGGNPLGGLFGKR
ncbi:MAG: M48 family metalloprotease [Alphaproteobacteria bacterium]